MNTLDSLLIAKVSGLMVADGWTIGTEGEIRDLSGETRYSVYQRPLAGGFVSVVYIVRQLYKKDLPRQRRRDRRVPILLSAWMGIGYPAADKLVEELLRRQWQGCVAVREMQDPDGAGKLVLTIDRTGEGEVEVDNIATLLVTQIANTAKCDNTDESWLSKYMIDGVPLLEALIGDVAEGPPSPVPMIYWERVDPVVSKLAFLACMDRRDDVRIGLDELEESAGLSDVGRERRIFACELRAWLDGRPPEGREGGGFRWDVRQAPPRDAPAQVKRGERRKALATVSRAGKWATRDELYGLLAREHRSRGIPIDPIAIEFEIDLIVDTRRRLDGGIRRVFYMGRKLMELGKGGDGLLVDVLQGERLRQRPDILRLPAEATYRILRVDYDWTAIRLNDGAGSWLDNAFRLSEQQAGGTLSLEAWFGPDNVSTTMGPQISVNIGEQTVGELDDFAAGLYRPVIESARNTNEIAWSEARAIRAPHRQPAFVLAVPLPVRQS